MSSGHDLNSLSRFRKQPERLVLEEHSHCEVPAGCGGVVLRWRNPLAAVPLTFHLFTPVAAACFLDGAQVRVGRVELAPGRHTVAFALENASLSAGLILFAAVHPGAQAQRTPPSHVTEAPLQVLTADDGTWKCTLHRPATEDWMLPAFDDHDWLTLTLAPPPPADRGTGPAYQYGECVRKGAACLGLAAAAAAPEAELTSWWQRLLRRRPPPAQGPGRGAVWMRKVFDIPPPQLRES
jgi:hypothetical protein